MNDSRDATASRTLFWSLSLVPVQEWIAAARRSRDLLVGSALLSWLMARILRSLASLDAEVVVPSPKLLDRVPDGPFRSCLARSSYSLSNRASGVAAPPSGESLLAALRRAQENVVDAGWRELVEEVSRRGGPGVLGAEGWRLILPELQGAPCPVQLVWAAKWSADESVEAGLREVDRIFVAAKRNRPLAAHSGAPVGKCGQCARREAMGGRSWKTWRAFQRKLSGVREVQMGFRLEPADRLCPVCGVKRLAGYLTDGANMPSTSEIAAGHWLARVKSMKDLDFLVRALEDLLRHAAKVEGRQDDPHPLLFQRSRDRLSRELGDDGTRQAAVDRVLEAANRFRQAIADARTRTPDLHLPQEPPSYLAVIVLDGDDIGRAVHERPYVMCDRLADFAGSLDALVREHDATPVYLGGDEGLILSPLERALDLAQAIHAQWESSVRAPDEAGGHRDTKPPPTLSIGLCVFDRERPLGGAILEAQNAVEMAKALSGKNALTVTIQTASGSTWSARAHWGADWNRVRQAIGHIRSGSLSAGWVYDVEDLLRSLPLQELEASSFRSAVRSEVERLTRRRTRPGGPSPDEIWNAVGGESLLESFDSETADELPDLFHAIGFFAHQAGGAAEAT